jgi:sodium/hydrogen antiporter
VTWTLAIVALAVLAVAAVSRQLSSTPVTPAMVFVAIGVLVGPLLLDEVNAAPKSSTVRTLAEATLALVLFSDASRIDTRTLRRESNVPVRLLGIGLPLTIAIGSLLAAVLFAHLSVSEAVIIGVILAPTDAGLGRAVVTDSRLPQRIRQSLNLESGLNDGVCVPLLLIALAAASSSGHTGHVVLEEIGWGIAAGAAAGGAGGLRREARRREGSDRGVLAPADPGRRRCAGVWDRCRARRVGLHRRVCGRHAVRAAARRGHRRDHYLHRRSRRPA